MALVSNRYYTMLDKKGPEVLHSFHKLKNEHSQTVATEQSRRADAEKQTKSALL